MRTYLPFTALSLLIISLTSLAGGHTLEEIKKEFGEVSEPLVKITNTLEVASHQPDDKEYANLEPYQQGAVKAERGALREQLHAVQHQMLADHGKAQLKMKCVELLKRISVEERRVQKLEKAGKTREAEQIQSWIDENKAFATVNCSPGTMMP